MDLICICLRYLLASKLILRSLEIPLRVNATCCSSCRLGVPPIDIQFLKMRLGQLGTLYIDRCQNQGICYMSFLSSTWFMYSYMCIIIPINSRIFQIYRLRSVIFITESRKPGLLQEPWPPLRPHNAPPLRPGGRMAEAWHCPSRRSMQTWSERTWRVPREDDDWLIWLVVGKTWLLLSRNSSESHHPN